jgi:hypothetical protein
MVTAQIACGDHDLHWRKTAQYGRAALALHPPRDFEVVGGFDPERDSEPHVNFYLDWFASEGGIATARHDLAFGDISFRFYRKYTKVTKVF